MPHTTRLNPYWYDLITNYLPVNCLLGRAGWRSRHDPTPLAGRAAWKEKEKLISVLLHNIMQINNNNGANTKQ